MYNPSKQPQATHCAKIQLKINQFGWVLLSHPPYKLDMAPFDYRLFRSLQHQLSVKVFHDEEEIKTDFSHSSPQNPSVLQGILKI